ncbi:MAG: hypothetical protein RL634_1279, partial [Bacteroidota bacterium]
GDYNQSIFELNFQFLDDGKILYE